jgi:23S rRNA (cytosine1962-C5)-methyltransferase
MNWEFSTAKQVKSSRVPKIPGIPRNFSGTSMSFPTLFLKPGREKSVKQHHPWIFSGAVARVEGDPQPGETVRVMAFDGESLALAAYSPQSSIRARIWTWNPDEIIQVDFFRTRIEQAIQSRTGNYGPHGASRLVYGESDGLPGLIVDRYADTIVMQCLSWGAEFWRDTFAGILMEQSGITRVFERSDADVRALEGLATRVEAVRGDAPPTRIEIIENALRFGVDVGHGHKTGFYLDQRANRQLVREMASGREVLNCFAYTGAFTVYALAGGAASVLSIESSEEALRQARENVTRNHLPVEKTEWIQGDVFQELRTLRDRAWTFDLIILDPPKFAATASQAERAARGYKDINLLALKLLRPGGMLFTFSCSGGVSAELFEKIVAGAALDAGVEAQIIGRMNQGADHPVALHFPEGAYLKGLMIRKR